ncbi:MAG: hypothetical protein COY42_04500 [Armatimonadetes bacterium CG_4_10_14_0_8_um_filter_66_14]|nr:MAG: hypothetical protein COY42_04500 [Armatimonadetes bacterium CG_4_10_14_0_8_um_filter_66_14]
MSATIGKVKRPSVCKGRSVVTLVVVLLSGAGTAVPVAADWGVTIGASVSATQVYGDTAEAAFAPGATDGFDTYAVDQPEAPAPPQGVRVYFPHPEWKSDTQPVELFTRDAGRPLPDCSARLWAFTVESVDLAGDVSLVFDLSTLPADHTATLTDVTTGEQYDLRSGGYPGFAITAGGTRQFTLRVARMKAELLVESLTVAPVQGSETTVRTVTAVVKNVGGQRAAETRTAFWVKRTSAAKPLEKANRVWPTNALDAGESQTLTWSFKPADYSVGEGWQTAVAMADWSQLVAECSESNSTPCSWYVTPAAKPDLVVAQLTLTPAEGGSETLRTVTCKVKNIGSGTTGETRTALWIKRTTAPVPKEAGANRVWVTPALASGAETTLTWTCKPGDYNLGADWHTAVALADWAEQVAEENETNNRAGASWAIYDLIVDSLTISPQQGADTTTRTVTCVVKNIGGGKTPETRTALWLKRTSAPQPLETGANRVWVTPGLVRMQTATFTWTFTPKDYGLAVGTHTAVALADWAKQAAEGSETNNAKGCSWSVTTGRADAQSATETASSAFVSPLWLLSPPGGGPLDAWLQSLASSVRAVLEEGAGDGSE